MCRLRKFLFSALSGYDSTAARTDMAEFLAMVGRPRGIHLCGKPDWDFLLNLDLDILSLNVYLNGAIFANYAQSIKRFLDRGGVIAWGLVPTNFGPFATENAQSLTGRLAEIWSILSSKEIDRDLMLARSLPIPRHLLPGESGRRKDG